MEEKTVYQIENKLTLEIDKDDPNAKDIYYINKCFKEILVNFV